MSVTLRDVLDEEAAAGLDDVEAVTSGDCEGGAVVAGAFPALTGDVAEFQLDGPVASAAARTSDTLGLRKRGPDWVRIRTSAPRPVRGGARAWLALPALRGRLTRTPNDPGGAGVVEGGEAAGPGRRPAAVSGRRRRRAIELLLELLQRTEAEHGHRLLARPEEAIVGMLRIRRPGRAAGSRRRRP